MHCYYIYPTSLPLKPTPFFLSSSPRSCLSSGLGQITAAGFMIATVISYPEESTHHTPLHPLVPTVLYISSLIFLEGGNIDDPSKATQ